MLTLFRTNQLLAGVLLLPYLVLLRLDWFWRETVAIAPLSGIGNAWVVPWLNQQTNGQFWAFLVLVFIQALLANSLVAEHRLARSVNLLPGVFVCFLASLLPVFDTYSGYLLGNVFMLLGVRSLLGAFRKMSAAIPIFNAGIWLGTAMLFVPSYCWLLLPFGIALTILKSGRFRDQYILLSGAVLPFYLLAIYYFWTDRLDYFWTSQWNGTFSWPELMHLEWPMIPGLILCSGLLVFVLLSSGQLQSKMKMGVQTKIGVLYWILFGLGLSVLWTMPWDMQKWLAIAPIAGILLSMYFSKIRSTTAESLHLLLLVALAGLHWWEIVT